MFRAFKYSPSRTEWSTSSLPLQQHEKHEQLQHDENDLTDETDADTTADGDDEERLTSALIKGNQSCEQQVSVPSSSPTTLPKTATNAATTSVVSTPLFKLVLLCTLTIQTAGYVLLGRYISSSRPAEEMFDIRHVVCMSELIKLIVCCLVESYNTGGRLQDSLLRHVWSRPWDASKAAVPAVMFFVQNSLTYVAFGNLSAPLYVAMAQGKLIITAFVSVLLLKRTYVLRQWTCLFTLTAALTLILIEQDRVNKAKEQRDDNNDDKTDSTNLLVGFFAIVGACLCSAFASVFMEGVMKRDSSGSGNASPAASLWMRNIQLAFFGVCAAASQSNLWNGTETFFHGFTTAVWCTAIMHAGGGLLVAAVMKYTDNVLKGLAIAMSVILISVLSSFFFGVQLTQSFVAGACVISLSVYFFSNPVPAAIFRPIVGKHLP